MRQRKPGLCPAFRIAKRCRFLDELADERDDSDNDDDAFEEAVGDPLSNACTNQAANDTAGRKDENAEPQNLSSEEDLSLIHI